MAVVTDENETAAYGAINTQALHSSSKSPQMLAKPSRNPVVPRFFYTSPVRKHNQMLNLTMHMSAVRLPPLASA